MSRLQHLTLWFAAVLIRAIVVTLGAACRVRVIRGAELLEEIFARRDPVVFAFWHNQSFVFAYLLWRRFLSRGYRFATLSSRSRDGELGAKLGRMWRATVIRGSASRGGSEGLRRLYRAMRAGESCVILPDGPRGPRYQAKPGAVVLAQMTGAPLVPMAMAVDRGWRLRSWDRLIIPKPFARVAVVVGEPLEVPRELPEDAMERERRRLEQVLEALRSEAESGVGVR